MNKKILILFVVFSVFLSISAVSANNVTADMDTYSTIDESSNSEILSVVDDDTSYTALNALINSGNNIIDITKDYTFNNESDGNFIGGIQIDNTNIVINGNNHTIDGQNQARCFRISNASNVVINDLILKNSDAGAIVNYGELKTSNVEFNSCYSSEGGALYMIEAQYISENDRFIRNFAQTGATIYSDSSVVTINNGNFEYNSGVDGVISSKNDTLTIKNSYFKNNHGGDGAVIKSQLSNVTFNNSFFENNSADQSGVIYPSTCNLSIGNCLFEGNSADTGSAICALFSNVTVSNSLLKNNRNNWSSIYLENSKLDVYNTTFANSTSKYATAIYNKNGETNIKKSKFVELFANITAGALAFKQSSNVTIEDCEFKDVISTKNGGAIFVDIIGSFGPNEGKILINNSKFENCLSGFGGAYLQLGGELSIDNSNFTDNFAEFNGGAIYLSYVNATIDNSIFAENNVVLTYDDYPTYGGAIFSDNSLLNVYDSRFTNNSAVEGSAIYIYDTDYDLDNLEFDGNDNAIYAVFDEGSKSNLKGTDKISEDDFNNTEYYSVVDGTGMQVTLLNNNENITYIPARYDLREENLVTPVRDQGYMGACWAFGMTAALESALLKAMNYTSDFSENNMQNSMLIYSKFGTTKFESGDNIDAIAYLVSWLGAFPQDYDVYDELGKISPLIQTDKDFHVQDVIIIPHTPGDKDNIDVKTAILKYGALGGTILSKATKDDGNPTDYYNENTSAEYAPDHLISNHMICIVGWDDNYPASNFAITPPGDGAWIVKNSWGTDWGDEGYFYVSYYDQTLSAFPNNITECFVAFVIENTLPYNKNYQYDFSQLSYFYKDDNSQLTYFNSFESVDDDFIAAVGTYFDGEGVEYKVEIDVNNETVYNQIGVSPFYGYHTIKLDEYVSIKKGDKFTVAITSNAVPVCRYTRTYYKAGTSAVLFPNGGIEDLSGENMTACLKVYTLEDTRRNTTIIAPDKVININDAVKGFDYQFILKDEKGNALANKEVMVSFNGINQTVMTDENGYGTVKLYADAEGVYDVVITFEGDSDYYGICQTATIEIVGERGNATPNKTVPADEMSIEHKVSSAKAFPAAGNPLALPATGNPLALFGLALCCLVTYYRRR
ncbi:C1 family peptidase [Methanobrevibacter sp.]|uniref:C1 family peptidase n=1 Tax=Methanobrevibacter sp. TaxID=66852 RepID=UPI003890B1AC